MKRMRRTLAACGSVLAMGAVIPLALRAEEKPKHSLPPAKNGGTIGVSCGNCHPNGANTHPETYPKYQVQLQRVALLRDMINWCIENPVKGKALADDDPKMRALEAYILSTRKGVALEYGKH